MLFAVNGRRGRGGRIGAEIAALVVVSTVGCLVLFVELFDGLDLLFELHTSVLEPDLDLSLR